MIGNSRKRGCLKKLDILDNGSLDMFCNANCERRWRGHLAPRLIVCPDIFLDVLGEYIKRNVAAEDDGVIEGLQIEF